MRLKRLEMIGFKSFAQRTVIELNPGVTAVVGPNGCGKSNIVDALRWAMGEQSARHLRGHQMEDVVFNGSDSLPATGMAEVAIVFDNEDGQSPAEYANFSEIMVTRRLFRSGESEYAINKVNCRLKDVVELFLGTGVGSKAYSIVEQGKVDELVNSKPEDRRSIIEEAAGTSKYKSRKIVAEKKLERTQQNLLRVTDIVREIERQIRSMELQAKKAERYRALKSELKGKELAFALLQREGFNQEITRQEAQLASVENRWAEVVAALRSKEAENESVRLSLLEADKEIGHQQETLYRRHTEIQKDEQKCEFFRKDLAQLNQNETDTRNSLLQLEERTRATVQEISELNKAKENFIQLSLFEETFLREKESELEVLQAQTRTLQSELERERDALIDMANQIANLKNDTLSKEKRRSEISKELARSQEEMSQVTASLAASDSIIAATGGSLASRLEQIRERSFEAALATASIQSLNGAREDKEKKVSCLKEHLQETRSRLVSLEDIQKNYEGCQEGVRAIMRKKQQQSSLNGVYGLVAEVIEAPEVYEKALTAVLGERSQYVIVKGQQEGVEAIEYLKNEASGRGSFIPLEMSRKPRKELPLGEAEVVAPMLDVISVKEGYRDVAEYLLSDVVVVRDLQAGLSLWNRNGYYSTLVTREGEVIDPIGVVTGGSGASLEANFLSQRRRIRDLRTTLDELETQLPLAERESDQIKQELDQAETKKTLLTAEIHRLDIERVRLEHEKGAADEEIQRHHSLVQTHTEEKAERERTLMQKQAALAELAQADETAEAALTQSRIRHAALGEKRENTLANLANRVKLQDETAQEITTRQERIIDFQRRRREIEQALANTEESLDRSRTDLQTLEEQLQAEHAPVARVVEDCDPTIVLTNLAIDAPHPDAVDVTAMLDPDAPPTAPVEPGDRPAYAIYTSGTTGTPKGVVIGRRALATAVWSWIDMVQLDRDTRAICVSPFHFDGSFSTLFPTITGGCQVIGLLPDSLDGSRQDSAGT